MQIIRYIESTNEKILLKDGTNLYSLMNLYICFSYSNLGNPNLYDKLERMLATNLKDKKSTLDVREVVDMVN